MFDLIKLCRAWYSFFNKREKGNKVTLAGFGTFSVDPDEVEAQA
jgi:hypothetical protein